MEAPLGTDWLRSAPAPESWTEPEGLERRSAPAYMFPLQRNFRASVRIQGRWHGDWDQACIFLLEGRGEGDDNGQETHGSWIKVGVEHDAGYEFVGTVLTNPNSDWSWYVCQRHCFVCAHAERGGGYGHSERLCVLYANGQATLSRSRLLPSASTIRSRSWSSLRSCQTTFGSG